MTPRKLSDADKTEILERYRQPGETTLTLAQRYGVSNSTISRLLKGSLSPSEYESLIQQKRASRSQGSSTATAAKKEKPVKSRSRLGATPSEEASEESSQTSNDSLPGPRRRRKKRSSALGDDSESESETAGLRDDREESSGFDDADYEAEAHVIEEMLEEEIDDSDDLDDDLDDDDEDDDDFEEFDTRTIERRRTRTDRLNILPLADASFPKPCYLVVDRSAELITRPLKEFSDLGDIPSHEVSEKTLPVFDNHRVARRFSNRSQRVIKVPDGNMLQRTEPYLHAKGITRLLFDGQVYSL